MIEALLGHVLQYASYAIELVLVVALLARGRWKSTRALFVYIAGYFAVDAVLRPSVLYAFGFRSVQYRYVYWVSDVLLTLGAFLLICFFFRRACSHKPGAWSSYLRPMLAAVFVLIAFISYFSIADHYGDLFGRFIYDYYQNLYFACLILNTLLYIMLQQWDSRDEKLNLLVCGLGIEFAAPAADMALAYLTPGGHAAGALAPFLFQLCNLGMCLVWLHAVALKEAQVPAASGSQELANWAGPSSAPPLTIAGLRSR